MEKMLNQKDKQSLLKEAEAKYHHLFSHADDMIYLIDLKGIVLEANRASKIIIGYSPKELIGTDLLKLGCIPKSFHAQIRKQRQFRLSGDKNATRVMYEFEWIHKNGKTVFLETNAVPIYKNGKIIGLQCIARDITERKKIEQIIVARNQDLELLVQERTKKMKQLNKTLEKAIRERTKNLRVINHELQKNLRNKANFFKQTAIELSTPLSVMHQNAELLLSKTKSQEQAKIILKESEKLQNVLSDFLYLAAIDQKNPKMLEAHPIDWEELFVHVMHDLGTTAQEKNIHVDRAFALPAQTYYGNPEYLAKLIFHLLGNAIKFTDPKGTVSFGVEGIKKGIRLTVCDNGIGIAETHKKRIFDSFYKVSLVTDRDTEGTGIGLTICKSIAERHKGKITVQSAINKGTTVTVFLPFNNF